MFDIIDLHFQGQREVIASYVLVGPGGAALIETGPGSTLTHLETGLHNLGLDWHDITDVLVTHIHLDHAGAAGAVARKTGARVHVHHVGAPHLADPSRLLASAQRIYGDQMESLWGEFLPVPGDQLRILHDNDIIEAAGLRIQALDTPGHASHHMAYWVDGLCFTGDIAAARLPASGHIRLPTPPPDIDVPAWHASVDRLRRLRPDRLALTHFGPVSGDPLAHLDSVDANLDAMAAFVRQRWEAGLTTEAMLPEFTAWIAGQAAQDGADPDTIARYEVAVPSYMEVGGLVRYFNRAARPP
jgi:glyoxylase-like metal-dependent hydrolase (beta-lactamase superfamily II)